VRGHVLRRCPKPPTPACERGRCDHRWAFTFSNGTDPQTGRRRQHTGGGYRTERDADRALRTAITEAETGTLQLRRQQRATAVAAREQAEREVTVGAYLTAWLGRKAYRPNTADGHQMHIKVHITPSIGAVRLVDLQRRHVRDLLEHLATGPSPKTGRPRSRATLARIRATLTKALEDAVEDGLLTANPARGVRLPERAPDTAREMAVFTPAELARFLGTADRDRLGPLYRLMLHTGLRRGELVGLRWADVSLDEAPARLTVRQSITQRGGELRYGRPKTKKGERQVALDAGTADLLRRQRATQAVERLAAGPAWRDEDLAFPREDGTPTRPDTVTRHMAVLCRAAGVPVIRLHDGRHTHASLALAAGVDVKVVADRLGHSTTTITRDLYQHVLPQVATDAAEAIAAITRTAEAAQSGRQL